MWFPKLRKKIIGNLIFFFFFFFPLPICFFWCDSKGKLKKNKIILLESAAADMAKRGNGRTLFLLRDYYNKRKTHDWIDRGGSSEDDNKSDLSTTQQYPGHHKKKKKLFVRSPFLLSIRFVFKIENLKTRGPPHNPGGWVTPRWCPKRESSETWRRRGGVGRWQCIGQTLYVWHTPCFNIILN
jgi:hypothetical protein